MQALMRRKNIHILSAGNEADKIKYTDDDGVTYAEVHG